MSFDEILDLTADVFSFHSNILSDLNLFLQPLASLDHSEARNDQGRRVKPEFKKSCDVTAPF